jgi:3-oxoadipate enol-lactonase
MYLERGDRRFHYDVTGKGQTPALFIPALGATRVMWSPQVTALADRYRVITCDPAGRDRDTLYTVQPDLRDYAADCAALLREVADAPAHVVGLSMGGMIAQELALTFPELVASLTLANTTSEYPAEARTQMRVRAERVQAEGMATVIEGRLEAWFTPSFREHRPDVVQQIRQQLGTADPGAYGQAARAAASVDTTDRLGGIDLPALVIHAESDGSMPPGSAQLLAERLPRGELQLISDASHLCNVEQPGQFNERLERFLSSIAAG